MEIVRLIKRRYGRQGPLKKSEPVDELVRTILSQNTSDTNSLKAFAVLKKRFRSWDGILKTDTGRIAHLIRHAGLANIKAGRIKCVLKEIKRREGRLNLNRLKNMPVKDSLAYLRSLKGVGPKTAACVLLFSFGKPVMPVDTHIFRVTKRLGLIGDDITVEEAHEQLTRIVPKSLIYEFHLGIILHGRTTCKAQKPKCGGCILRPLCKHGRKSDT